MTTSKKRRPRDDDPMTWEHWQKLVHLSIKSSDRSRRKFRRMPALAVIDALVGKQWAKYPTLRSET